MVEGVVDVGLDVVSFIVVELAEISLMDCGIIKVADMITCSIYSLLLLLLLIEFKKLNRK